MTIQASPQKLEPEVALVATRRQIVQHPEISDSFGVLSRSYPVQDVDFEVC
jgi:hypothetical protein